MPFYFMDFRQKIIEYYGLSEEQYKELTKPVEELELPDFNALPDMAKIKERIFRAIKNQEKIIIYGDYDCDGFCSTAIMVKTFEKLGYKVSFYIPTRYVDGYAINVDNVIKMKNAGYSLIITVDNGISANEAIDKANELGIDVIVTDHHELGEKMVNAYGIIHHTVSAIPGAKGCGAFMALLVSAALLGSYDPYLVTLAGIATVGDLMELRDYNRNVVRISLDNLNKNKYKQIMALTNAKTINEKTYGFGW